MIFKILLAILFFNLNSLAQSTPSGFNEFNSETIEDGEFGTLVPISPKLVEETESDPIETIENEKSNQTTAAQKNSTSTKDLNESQKDQIKNALNGSDIEISACLLYTSPSPRDRG